MDKVLNYPREKDLERNRLLGIIEGGAAKIIYNLTSGAFLVGLLKYLGASDAVCGYIIAFPVLAAVVQFLSPVIFESVPSRKRIIIIGSMIHKVLLTALIIIPFLPFNTGVKLFIVSIMYLIAHISISLVTPAISTFYISFVPQNIRGKYFGGRESYILIASTIITLVLGKVLDVFADSGNELHGYVVIYILVLLLTLLDLFSYLNMKEVPLTHSKTRLKISEIFTLPFKNKRFIRYFTMLIIWNIAYQIASGFLSVYLKSDLALNYTTINVLGMVQSIINILAAKKWGIFADKKGWSAATLLSIGTLGISHMLWFVSSKGSPFLMLLLALAHIAGGIGIAGVNIALFNLQFDFTPDEKRTVYIGLSAAAGGIIGYVAAVFGAFLVGLFGSNKIMLIGFAFDIKQIIFLISSILLFVCSLYIHIFMKNSMVEKTEEVKNHV